MSGTSTEGRPPAPAVGSAPGAGPPAASRRPALAVWKFASCDGCQLTLLDCEDELLAISRAFDIAHFSEMSSASTDGPYDVSLVEGSITTPEDEQRIVEIRRNSHFLVTIGACATAGGIQALRNFAASGDYLRTVYAHPEYISALETSTPISAHVDVDFELHGCPVDRRQLLEVITAALAGRRPAIPGHSVCQECKGRGTVCLLVAGGVACLGPVTRAGCGALCPAVGRGCFGCFGPSETANTGSLASRLRQNGATPGELSRLFATFNVGAPAFLAEGERQAADAITHGPAGPRDDSPGGMAVTMGPARRRGRRADGADR